MPAVRNRAELARREGTSANRVTQILSLLELRGDLISALRALPPGTPVRLVTERELRRLHTTRTLDAVKARCCAWLRGAHL